MCNGLHTNPSYCDPWFDFRDRVNIFVLNLGKLNDSAFLERRVFCLVFVNKCDEACDVTLTAATFETVPMIRTGLEVLFLNQIHYKMLLHSCSSCISRLNSQTKLHYSNVKHKHRLGHETGKFIYLRDRFDNFL